LKLVSSGWTVFLEVRARSAAASIAGAGGKIGLLQFTLLEKFGGGLVNCNRFQRRFGQTRSILRLGRRRLLNRPLVIELLSFNRISRCEYGERRRLKKRHLLISAEQRPLRRS